MTEVQKRVEELRLEERPRKASLAVPATVGREQVRKCSQLLGCQPWPQPATSSPVSLGTAGACYLAEIFLYR